MATETKMFYPVAYDGFSGDSGNGLENPIGKGSSNTIDYAEITSYKRGSDTYCFWSFDVSAIPLNAEIDSVSCNARISGGLYSSEVQLYSGSMAKGSATSVSDISPEGYVYTLNTGVWTRSELSSVKIRVFVPGARMPNSALFFGADLTVTYTYNSEKFMLKTGGTWADVARVFKKVNGIWVEQTELASVVEDGVRYQNGGEIISPKKTVTITGTGDNNASTTAAECYVEINGVKYVSATTVEVDSGTTMLCYAHAASVSITLNGSSVGSGTPKQYTHTVNENCTVTLSVDVSFNSKATIAITTQ